MVYDDICSLCIVRTINSENGIYSIFIVYQVSNKKYIFYTMRILYTVYIGGSPADLSISYRESIPYKYILEREDIRSEKCTITAAPVTKRTD